MKRITVVAIGFTCLFLPTQNTYSQGFLKKLKEKANDIAEKAVEKKVGIDTPPSTNSSGGSGGSGNSSSSSGRPSNKGGAGLTNTPPPDVKQQIADAEQAQKAGNYSEARYSVQQALMGVELQLGKELLRSLPLSVSGLSADTTNDRVASTSWGWSNLTILRRYNKGDQQLEMTIGNLPMYAGIVNIYFSGAYNQSNGDNPSMKQIKVKGNKAVIKYDANEGYTLLVQLGQSSMIAWQGINLANENDMMAAVNTFDIEKIKKILGEK